MAKSSKSSSSSKHSTAGTGTSNPNTMSLVPTPATKAVHPQEDSEPVALPAEEPASLPVTTTELPAPSGELAPAEVVVPQPPTVEVTEPSASPAPEGTPALKLEGLQMMLRLAGLTLTNKSTEHWHGTDPLGPRLVVARGEMVKCLWLYLVEDASLPGFVPADERKARRLGRVTVVCANPTLAQARALVDAVAAAVGVKS